MADDPIPNPYDSVPRVVAGLTFSLSPDGLARLQAAVEAAGVDPIEAARVVGDVQKAVEEKKSAGKIVEIIGTVVSKAVGLLKPF